VHDSLHGHQAAARDSLHGHQGAAPLRARLRANFETTQMCVLRILPIDRNPESAHSLFQQGGKSAPGSRIAEWLTR